MDWSRIRNKASIDSMRRTGGCLQSYPTKHGIGKVHRLHWNWENSFWYVGCKGVDSPPPRGIVVARDTTITCQKRGCA